VGCSIIKWVVAAPGIFREGETEMGEKRRRGISPEKFGPIKNTSAEHQVFGEKKEGNHRNPKGKTTDAEYLWGKKLD